MSIDMYLGDSQSQANSTQTMIQEEIRAYEELERSLTDFESSAESLKEKLMILLEIILPEFFALWPMVENYYRKQSGRQSSNFQNSMSYRLPMKA